MHPNFNTESESLFSTSTHHSILQLLLYYGKIYISRAVNCLQYLRPLSERLYQQIIYFNSKNAKFRVRVFELTLHVSLIAVHYHYCHLLH